jgi:lipopolysaccharide transport system permease protein
VNDSVPFMLGFNRQDLRLALNLFAMNVRDRYLGSLLGSAWAIANPLFMLALYTFVFGFVLKVRLPGAETTFAYVIWLIIGYGPWLAIVEGISASTSSVVASAGMVKNLAFKTELLPVAAAGVGLISLCVSLSFVVILLIVDHHIPGWSVFWVPLIVLLQFVLIVALGFWLAPMNVFVRDLSVALPNLLTIIMFGTPIFYSIDSMPAFLKRLTYANPFYLIVEAYRAALLQQRAPDPKGLLYVAVLSLVLLASGLAAFRRAKGFFSSAL